MTKRALRWTARMPWLLTLGLALAFTPDAAASGEGMRCGSELVVEGDSMYEVRAACGDPDATFTRVEYRSVNVYVAGQCFVQNGRTVCGGYQQQTVPVQIDEWTYDFGSTSFIRFVTFEQGRLHRIVLGDYGKKRGPTVRASAPAAPAARPGAE